MEMKELTEKLNADFYHKLTVLVLPITLQNFMLSLVSASDAVMVGMLSQDSLSAVSLGGQVAFIVNLFISAATIGMNILLAQYWGKGDYRTVEQIFAYVMRYCVIVTALFTLAGFFIPTFLMGIFTSDPVLVSLGAAYLRAVSASYVLTGISQIYLCLLKNSGRAGRASLISSSSVVINIILNAVFIFGLAGLPRLEIVGAALATVIAKAIEVLWSFAETRRKITLSDVDLSEKSGNSAETTRSLSVRLRAEYLLHAASDLRRDFWKYAAPIHINLLTWGLGFTMYSVIMGHLGSDAVAANSIANIVKNIACCLCLGISGGSSIMVGNELGAGRLDTAKEYGIRLTKLSIIVGAASGLMLLAFTPLILRFTNLSAQATFYLQWMIAMCSYNIIGKSVNSTTIAGIFCAGGDSRFGMICDFVDMWIYGVPAGFLAAFVLKLPVLAVFFIINLDEMVKLPIVYHHFRQYRWVRNLTKERH